MGGDARDLVPWFMHLNHLLRHHRLPAAEQTLDIVRVQQKTTLNDLEKSAA